MDQCHKPSGGDTMRMKRAASKVLFTVMLASVMAFGGMQAQTTRHRIGATCNGATSSSATGSGACSHHGGVSCWQYSMVLALSHRAYREKTEDETGNCGTGSGVCCFCISIETQRKDSGPTGQGRRVRLCRCLQQYCGSKDVQSSWC